MKMEVSRPDRMIARWFQPTTLLWLFAHEIRLQWRGSILVRTRRHVLVPVIAVSLVFQAAAGLIVWAAEKHHFPLPILILAANINLLLFGSLMLSRAMVAAIDILYSRGDVDFLLASPIPPGRVLAVRMMGVAAKVASPWLLLGGVLANALAVFGHLQALAAYVMIPVVAVLATAAAFSLVVVLVGRIGPRAARTLSHLFALMIGLLIFALGQAPRYVPAAKLAKFWHGLMPNAANMCSISWYPGRAMLGEKLPLTACILLTCLVFFVVLAALGKQFAEGAISAAAFGSGAANRSQSKQFRQSPFSATALKNLRLLLRFPGLATQTVYRSLTLVPVAMILTGHAALGAGPAIVAPLIVFLTGQLALFFASVVIGSDQAADLFRSAPVVQRLRGQATAAAAGYATIVIMALPVMGILLRENAIFPVLMAGMAGAGLSNLAVGLKFPIPLMRAEFGKANTGTVLGLVLGVAISSVWAAAAWAVVSPHPFALLLLHPG